MSLLLTFVLVNTIWTSPKIDEYLKKDPALAGAKIKVCKNENSKSCATIDRTKEEFTHEEVRERFVDMSSTFSEIVGSIKSLEVTFQDPDSQGEHSSLKFKMSRKIGEK